MTDLHHAPIRDGHLAYLDVGQGTPLVLLHGGALDHRMWSRQVGALSNDHRVIAPDLRGHGRSSTPTGPFRHCDDIADLMHELGTGPAVVIGVSMGGSTAVDMAIEYPDTVAALVVSGAGSSEPDWRDPWMLALFATWERAAQEKDAEAWIDTFLLIGNGPHRTLDDLDPRVLEELREQAVHTITSHVSGGSPVLPDPVSNARQRARDISVPLLAISGTLDSDDHIRIARELAEAVADGSTVVIAGTAHYPNMEQPDEFNSAILEFLAQSVRPRGEVADRS
ncbi:alpha/beta fold hydrolase [Nakamurella sp. GG22]